MLDRSGESTRPRAGYGAGDALVAFAAALLGVVAGFLAFTPENLVWPFPWHHDDFYNLGLAGLHVSFGTVRPVSTEMWALLAPYGPMGLYAGLFVLVAAAIALSIMWVGEVLQARATRAMLAVLAFAIGAVFTLYELSPWVLRYTGHMTNALSATLGIAAALLALRVRYLGLGGVAAMVLLFALSAFAKEDFLLLPMLSVAWAGMASWRNGDRSAVMRAAACLVAFVLIAGAAMIYNLRASSPFIFGSGTYEVRLSPGSLVDAAGWYLFCTRYARNLLVGFLLATLVSLALRLARPSQWAVLWLALAALIAPYLPLSAHRYELYAFNWLPMMLAALAWTVVQTAAAFPSWRVRAVALACAVAAVVSLYGISKKQRRAQADYIGQTQAWSRDAYQRGAALVRERPDVEFAVVAGADQRTDGPWFANNGTYLNRALGRDVRWIVLLRPDSRARQLVDEQRWPDDWGRILLVDEACRSTLVALGLPLLDLEPPAAAGSDAGPEQGSSESARARSPAECGVPAAAAPLA